MFSGRWRVAALVICMLMIQPYPTVVKGAAIPSVPSIPVSLAVAISMKVLPADGATYPVVIVYLHDQSGAPTVATRGTSVYLISSAEAVGQVIPAVTIAAGQSFAVANFTTTRSPGKTQVTATATGLESGSAAVTTGTATGYPDGLKIVAVPNVVPARPGNQGSLIIELLDDSGLPAKAVGDTAVTLYSSNSKILNISQNLLIAAGQFIMVVGYTTGLVPGSSTVTASASGFQPGSTTVTVLGQAALALKLYAQPSLMNTCPPGGQQGCTGRLVIALLDLAGNPARAPRPITVFIRSSDLSVVNLPSLNYTVQIAVGNISVLASFTTTPKSGKAIITASSPNLASDFATVQTISAGTPRSLQLYIGPSTVLADHNSYGSVVVALIYLNGSLQLPALNSTFPTLVTLTSSVAATGNITKVFLSIPAGQSYAEMRITSTYQVGTTTITASAQNLLPTQGQLSTYGAIPSKIVIQALSSQLPADGSSHLGLEVMLQDSFGQPAIAPVGIPVNLTSSHNDIVSVAPTVIQAGQSFAIVNATTGALPGAANVTAVAPLSAGFSFSSTLIDTVIPSPSALAATVNAGSAFLTSVYGPTMVVQLQDAKGNPARARQTTNVTVTSSNSTIIGKTLVLQIGPGDDYGMLSLPVKSLGTTTLTVFSKGLTPASVALTIGPYPLQAQLTASTTTIPGNGSALLTAAILLDGVPLAGLPVSWNVTSGLLKTLNSTTGKDGAAQAYFQPRGPGSSTVTAAVSNSPYGSAKSSVTLYVLPIVEPVKPGLLETILTFPLVLAPVVAAVAGVVTVLFILRKRRRSVEEITDEGYESLSR